MPLQIILKTFLLDIFGITIQQMHICLIQFTHPDFFICLHHEQACVMVAHGYYMQSGKWQPYLYRRCWYYECSHRRCGAWADSIPMLVLSGQEATKQSK